MSKRTGRRIRADERQPGPTHDRMTDIKLPADKTLLLVDDDKPFLTRLARAMEARGFEVRTAESVAEGVDAGEAERARLCGGRSAAWRRQRPRRHRGAAPGAARCPRRGADRLWQYRHRGDRGEARRHRLSGQARRCRCRLWRAGRRHRQPHRPAGKSRCRPTGCAGSISSASIELCNRNVSETARRLNMHRRTLQRILAKRAPK